MDDYFTLVITPSCHMSQVVRELTKRKKPRIPNKENRRIIPHKIPIPLLRIELHTKPPRIPRRIRTPLLAAHRTEPAHDLRLLSHSTEDVRIADVSNVVRDDELAICASTFGVNDALGDALAVEMGEEVDEVEILEQNWSVGSYALESFGAVDGCAVGGCVG
jgi:hypothetical protein